MSKAGLPLLYFAMKAPARVRDIWAGIQSGTTLPYLKSVEAYCSAHIDSLFDAVKR